MATDREITESEVRHLLAERIGDRGIAVIAGELDENEIDIYMMGKGLVSIPDHILDYLNIRREVEIHYYRREG